MAYLLIDPESRLNFQHDWSDWLVESDTISSRQWSISPVNPGSPSTGPTLSNATSDIVFVEDVLPGMVYALTEHVVTASGLEDERTIVLRVDHT